MSELTPKCPRCGTRLWERTGGPDRLWFCGRFPECGFEVMNSTVEEAMRRQRRKQLNTAAVSG